MPDYLFFVCLYVNRFLVLRQRNSLAHHSDAHPFPGSRKKKKKGESLRDKLPQFSANHFLSNQNLLIILPIMHGEPQTDKVRQDRCRACLRADCGSTRRRRDLTGEWETEFFSTRFAVSPKEHSFFSLLMRISGFLVKVETYGTMLGPGVAVSQLHSSTVGTGFATLVWTSECLTFPHGPF